MNSEKKSTLFTEYTHYTKIFLAVIIAFLALFGLISMLIFPSEQEVLKTSCREFETVWEQILPDGTRIPVEVPGKLAAERGEVVKIVTTLPTDVKAGETLCFRTSWQDAAIYVDGELRLVYDTKDTRPFGANSTMRYLFLDLSEADSGKEVSYHFSSDSKYAGRARTVYIGDRLSIWLHLINISGPRTIISALLFLLSLSCIIVCIILKLVYKKTLPLTYLAWTLLFSSIWLLSEIEFRQLIIKNVSVLSYFTYWSLMIIPFPLLLYINDIQNHRYQKVYMVPLTYSACMLIVGTILQIFEVVQFVSQVPYIHAGLLTSIVCVIVTITMDTFTGKFKEYLSVGIGIYGLLVTAIGEIVFYYISSALTLGTILALGLLFLLLMAIIKTGQDLLHSEKKKQQAITARDAQSKFLANMSHEIRTPINAIIGMNEMILRENEDAAIQDYARNIHSASNMLLGLVNDVLDFTKIESGQLELVENTYQLDTLLKDEMLLLRARTDEKPIATHLNMDASLPSKLYGDELRIKQVLTNLLSNAVKYTPQGSVTLKVSFTPIDTETINLCFSIIDTGIGIKKEDLSELFDSFKRLDLNKNRNIQGTGLGLNIAKQLVDLMHGKIIVDSEYGKGSTFTVSIPQKVMDKCPIGNLEPAHDKPQSQKKGTASLFTAPAANILIVDDNAMNLSLMKNLLKRTQVNIDLAASGRECLELTKFKKYHIIFMDHMMPELDGIETLRLLRADTANSNHDAIVIALTANAIAGCREIYINYGFNDYFSKPVQVDKLEAFMMQHLPTELITLTGTEKQSQSVATTTADSADLLAIDWKSGISYCGDSEEFYLEVLEEFCRQAGEYLPQLEEFFQNQDWVNYAIVAHSLKTNSLTVGAVNFSKLSLQHELAGKERNESFIQNGYQDYIHTLKELIDKISEML